MLYKTVFFSFYSTDSEDSEDDDDSSAWSKNLRVLMTSLTPLDDAIDTDHIPQKYNVDLIRGEPSFYIRIRKTLPKLCDLTLILHPVVELLFSMRFLTALIYLLWRRDGHWGTTGKNRFKNSRLVRDTWLCVYIGWFWYEYITWFDFDLQIGQGLPQYDDVRARILIIFITGAGHISFISICLISVNWYTHHTLVAVLDFDFKECNNFPLLPQNFTGPPLDKFL